MKKYILLGLSILAGASAGFAYYYFIGCSSGTCPITSNWHSSTLFGAVAGLIIGMPGKIGCRSSHCGVDSHKPAEKKDKPSSDD